MTDAMRELLDEIAGLIKDKIEAIGRGDLNRDVLARDLGALLRAQGLLEAHSSKPDEETPMPEQALVRLDPQVEETR